MSQPPAGGARLCGSAALASQRAIRCNGKCLPSINPSRFGLRFGLCSPESPSGEELQGPIFCREEAGFLTAQDKIRRALRSSLAFKEFMCLRGKNGRPDQRLVVAEEVLQRIGFLRFARSRCLECVRAFVDGKTPRAVEILCPEAGVIVSDVRSLLLARGVVAPGKASMGELVFQLVELDSDEAHLRDLMESETFRKELIEATVDGMHPRVVKMFPGRYVFGPSAFIAKPKATDFRSAEDCASACRSYIASYASFCDSLAKEDSSKSVRFSALVQRLNEAINSSFSPRPNCSPPEEDSLPLPVRNVLLTIVENFITGPVEELDDFVEIASEVKGYGAVDDQGRLRLHDRSLYARTDFALAYQPPRPLPFFDNMTPDCLFRICQFLTYDELCPLVEASPATRAIVYMRLRENPDRRATVARMPSYRKRPRGRAYTYVCVPRKRMRKLSMQSRKPDDAVEGLWGDRDS